MVNSLFGEKKWGVWQLSIYSNALNRSNNKDYSLGEATKKRSLFSDTKALRFFKIFLELQKTVFFLSGQALILPPFLEPDN